MNLKLFQISISLGRFSIRILLIFLLLERIKCLFNSIEGEIVLLNEARPLLQILNPCRSFGRQFALFWRGSPLLLGIPSNCKYIFKLSWDFIILAIWAIDAAISLSVSSFLFSFTLRNFFQSSTKISFHSVFSRTDWSCNLSDLGLQSSTTRSASRWVPSKSISRMSCYLEWHRVWEPWTCCWCTAWEASFKSYSWAPSSIGKFLTEICLLYSIEIWIHYRRHAVDPSWMGFIGRNLNLWRTAIFRQRSVLIEAAFFKILPMLRFFNIHP